MSRRLSPAKPKKKDSAEDEVYLRLSLKGIRDRRRRGKDENREDVSCGSSVQSSKDMSMQSMPSKSIDKRALAKKVSYSDNVGDDHSHCHSTYSKASRGTVGEASINSVILNDLWTDDAATVETGLKKIAGILSIKKSSKYAARAREMIFRAGGHLAIVQAMRKHKNSVPVQGEGCRALGIAAEEIADSGNENAIAAVGGIDVILAAMINFRHEEQIQDFGCGALQNLTGVIDNSKILLERGGLSIILNSMRNYPESTLIQESACWTIVNLCQRKENRSKIEKAKCLSSIASAIDNHPNCPEVKKAAQEALHKVLELISDGDEE